MSKPSVNIFTEGVCASVSAGLSTMLLSPLELMRVRAVANESSSSCSSSKTAIQKSLWERLQHALNMFQHAMYDVVSKDMYSSLLRSSHASISSLLYFVLYRYSLKVLKSNHSTKENKTDVNLSLFAANLSAVIAVLMTSPLDRYVYRSQIKEYPKDEIKDVENRKENFSSIFYKQFEGVIPALLLCINPAIFYASYDRLKYELLLRKGASPRSHHLSSSEALIVSVCAKLLSTLSTYPLVRVKLLLMTKNRILHNKDDNEKSDDFGRTLDMLKSIVVTDGIFGLYRGFFEHLSYATIRSSASMVRIRKRNSLTSFKQTH
jgi:Mitochondrial carrier protein